MRYYLIDDNADMRYEEGEEEELLGQCISHDYFYENQEDFDEYLDYDGSVEVCGYYFYPSKILQEMDSEAYSREFDNWVDSQVDNAWQEARYDVEHTRPDGSFYVCQYEIYVYEEDDEDDIDESVQTEQLEDIMENIKQAMNSDAAAEEETHKENQRLEESFMSIFQTLK